MKKKLLTIIFLFIVILGIGEVSLRIIGFGNPMVYENKENYYPKSNQKVTRFMGTQVTINEFGMRATDNWKNENDKYKILFYGDSVTFGGSYVDNKDLFSEKLCILIKNSLCGNYGVNGYQLHNLNLRIRETLKKISFDHIIVVVSDSFSFGKVILTIFHFTKNLNIIY